jgi:hypothetical protein
MTQLASWCRRIWMALGLRGRLVAGYSGLFAVLLLGIAVGETTVVRRVLIDSRAAALPAALNDLGAFLHEPPPSGRGGGDQAVAIGGAVLNVEGPLPALTGNREMVLALLCRGRLGSLARHGRRGARGGPTATPGPAPRRWRSAT